MVRVLPRLWLWVCLLGCSRESPPIAVDASVATGPSRANERVRCSSDRDCSKLPSPVGQTLLCEQSHCEAYDSALALRWARALIPEIDHLQVDPNVKISDAPWYAEERMITLYARDNWLAPDRLPTSCVGLTLTAHQGRLFADLDPRGRSTVQGPCSARLSLGSTVRLWDQRCRDGVPSEHGGEERVPFDRLLSRADARGLVYAALPVQIEPVCQWTSVEREGCTPARCELCTGLYLQTSVSYGNTRSGSVPRNVLRELPSKGCGPCLPDTQSALLPRLSAVFARHRFTQLEEDGGGALYIDRRSCEAALRE
jgi:hypothetical protein